MPKLSEQEKYARTRRRERYLLWALLLIIGLMAWLLLAKSCGEAKDTKKAYEDISTALKEALDREKNIRERASELEQQNQQLDMTISELVYDRDMIQGALIDESEKSNRLAQEVKKAKSAKDTTGYIVKCDSLSDVVIELKSRINEQKKVDSMVYVSLIKRSDNLQAQVFLWKGAYDSCINTVRTVDTLLPQIKPTGQLCVVATGMVSGPILGIGGGFTYVTRNKVLIGARGFATNQGLLTTIEFGVPLNFRRK
jgi:hypothetical protein